MRASYRGTLVFVDEHCLEVGLDAFEAIHGLPIMAALRVTGTSVSIDACDDPSSTYDVAVTKLHALADLAREGEIACSLAPDRVPMQVVTASGRSSSRGLPARHHRWAALFAAEAGDAVALRDALDAGAAVDTRYWFARETLLHRAAHAGSAEAVEILLAAGAEVDALAVDDRTPLFDATTRAVAALLVARGADARHRTESGSSLLAHACAHGHAEVARFVLARGDTIVHADEFDELASACAYEGLVDVMRTLAARVPAFVHHLRDPAIVDAAIEAGRPEIVDFLLEHGAPLPDDFLAKAIEGGSVELVELAMRRPDAGASCGPSNEHADAMCRAARTGNVEIMEVLARHGVAVHPEVPGQTSPIHAAAGVFDDTKRRACLDWLLAQGVDIDAPNRGNAPPMATISFTASVDALVDLIDRGARHERLSELVLGPRYAALQRRLAKK